MLYIEERQAQESMSIDKIKRHTSPRLNDHGDVGTFDYATLRISVREQQ